MKPAYRIPSVYHERSHIHDVLTKQIAVRGDPSRCDYIIAARELSGNHDPASSVRSVCSSRATSSAHKRTRTHMQSDYPFCPFVPFGCCPMLPPPLLPRRCRCRPCLHSILIPIRVYGFACSRALLREPCTHRGAAGCIWMHHVHVHVYARMRARLIRGSCTSYVMLVRCQLCLAITTKGTRKSMGATYIKGDGGNGQTEGETPESGSRIRDVLSHEEVVV